MTGREPVRMTESHGVEDQTSEDWQDKKACNNGEDPFFSHHMISVKTGSPKVPYVEVCSDCGFIDALALEWWADNAIKLSLQARAARIAVAAESEPFNFVQSSAEELELAEVLGQAMGAASICWVGGTGSLEFDGTRAKSVFERLYAEVQRFQRLALEDAATRAVNLLAANHTYLSEEGRLAAFRKAIETEESE